MSEPNFTPGPWKVRGWNIFVEKDSSAICSILPWDFGGCRENGDANAALIAAAPELYAALEAFLGWTQSPLEDSWEKLAAGLEQVTVYAYAALAKARGEW